jgi:hypothetical protein
MRTAVPVTLIAHLPQVGAASTTAGACAAAAARRGRQRPAKPRRQGREEYIARVFARNTDTLFFAKNLAWAAEHEYRLVCRAEQVETPLIDVSTSLLGVVAGPTLTRDHTHRLRDAPSRTPASWRVFGGATGRRIARPGSPLQPPQ